MRVPTYKAQTKRTAKTGAISFNVSASPGALSAPQKALTELAGQAQDFAFKMYEMELSAKRSAELAQAEDEFDKLITQRKLESLNTPAGDVQTLWSTNTSNDIAKVSNTIKDSVVLRRFKAKANDAVSAATFGVIKDARVRAIDDAKAGYLQDENRLIQKMATGNPMERQQAQDELFGVADPVAVRKGLPAKRVGGLYVEMANLGIFKATDLVEREQKAKGRVDAITVANEITAAAVSEDPGQALAVLNKLTNPANYKDLGPEKRNQLITQANSLVGTLQNKRNADEARAIRLGEKQTKIRHSKNFNDFLGRIADVQNGVAGAEMPSSLEIAKAFQADRLDDNGFEALQQLALGQDAPADNAALVASFYTRIDQAQNQREIDDILKEVPGKMGPAGSLMQNTAIGILKYGNSAKGNTTESKEIARYRGLLSQAIGDVALGGMEKFNPTKAQRRADALDAYAQLTNPASPNMVPAKDAYQIIKNAFMSELSEGMTFIAPTAKVRDYVRDNLGPKKAKDISLWTTEDVDATARFVANSTNLTPLERALEIETLEEIQAFVDERDRIAASVDTDDNQDTGAGGAQDNSLIQNILNVIRGNQNPTGE